jgi:sugar phosphate isomerase/epimerase
MFKAFNGFILFNLLFVFSFTILAQEVPTGNAKDFKIKTCLHSVSYAGVWRGQAQLTVDEFLDKAKELGFDGIALVSKRPHVSPYDYDEAGRKRLKNRLSELGLKLVYLAGYTDFTAGIDKPGIPHLEIQALYVRELSKLAHDLGTKMIRIFTGYERPNIPYDKQYATVIEGLKMAGREAAKYGVTLAVQNHHDIGLHHDAMYWLLEEVNMTNVKAGWDAWSPTLQGLNSEQIRESILKMKPFIVNTIAAQYVRLPRFSYEHKLTNYLPQEDVLRAVPMEEGIIDYDMFINTLKEIGYQGYISYEMCEVLKGGGSIENLDKTAKDFLKYIKKFE